MNIILHPSDSRGHAAHGWLDSWHSFSFGSYFNPDRMHFGALRVLNDDTVAPGMGFGKHPHDNMEIISIPLEGALEHQDNTGTKAIIKKGDVQVMSAGTGIAHSEKNASHIETVKFLQIWIIPNRENVPPRYQQISFADSDKENKFLTIVSPMSTADGGVQIYQDAWASLGHLSAGTTIDYKVKKDGNGVYAFVLEGSITISGQTLNRRYAAGITATETLSIQATTNAEVLLMDLPML